MDRFEDEPNDDYESYAMRQNRMQPHGGQLMLTTQVTKAPPGFDRKASWFACDALADWCDITALESEKVGTSPQEQIRRRSSCLQKVS